MSAPGLRPWTLATFNMLRGGGRRVNPAQVLRDTEADLLMLQEAATLDAVAAPSVWQPIQSRRWGSAIVARIGRLERLPIPRFDGWVAAARWEVPGRRSLIVVSVHAPSGLGGYAGRVHDILDALAAVAAAPGIAEDVIIGGDFNICISKRHHTGGVARAREQEVQLRLREEFGLINCWDTLHARTQPAQTLRWTGNTCVPYHCDGLFVPAAWGTALRSCVVRNNRRWRAQRPQPRDRAAD
jgi:hypothetical protein